MGFKKNMGLLVFIIFIFGMASVCASDVNDAMMVSKDTGQMILSAGNKITDDNLQINEENETLTRANNYESLGVESGAEILGADEEGNYSDLRKDIENGGNLTKSYYRYEVGDGETIKITTPLMIIDGNGAIIDMAGSPSMRVFEVNSSGVTIKNLTIKNANSNGDGGAIYFNASGTVEYCNFTNNVVTGDANYGGAVFFSSGSVANVTNCNFISNTAPSGGAIRSEQGNVTDCNFIDNKATRSNGGSVCFFGDGIVSNCNFTGSSAKNSGGSVYFNEGVANVTNCNFVNNSARYGGAIGCGDIYVKTMNSSTVTNCNFTNNSAIGGAGAVYIDSGVANVTNCNFTNNNAVDRSGGALYLDMGDVENCNFINNFARMGGALLVNNTCNVSNSNFINNFASLDGAAVSFDEGNVINCNFINNSASNDGGAIWATYSGNVAICNFIDNSASHDGGAIFCLMDTIIADTCIFKTDSDTIFQTNTLSPKLNVDDFTTFYGSGEKLTFDLRTNRNSIPVTNGNISMSVYFNDNHSLVGNYDCLSGEGWIPDLPVGSYYAVFDTEYEEFQSISRTIKITIPSIDYYINVTSVTTNNRTVNITAESNIPKNILWDGKLQFILRNGSKINATYCNNGTWWAVHTFENYATYSINASYVGLDNVYVSRGIINIIRANSTITLDDIVLNYGESINVTVTTEGAIGITAKIGENDVDINNFTIPIFNLGAGNYTLTVKTIPDEDHVSVSKAVKITVNKLSTEIKLTNETLDLKVNGTVGDFAQLTPDVGTLDYTSSNDEIAKVVDGKIIALMAGKANITVSYGGNENYTACESTIDVTVTPMDANVTVNKTEYILYVDGEADIIANTNPEGLTIGYVTDDEFISVDDKGHIKALGEGNATILVSVGDNRIYTYDCAVVTVTVNKIPTEIILTNETLDLKVGNISGSVANLYPSDAGNLTFNPSDESVVKVTAGGLIIGLAKGNATVTVSFAGNNKYAAAENKTIFVTVTLRDASVSVKNNTFDMKVDDTFDLNATSNPDLLDVQYSSGNESVAKVNDDGIVTAVGEGTAIITLTVGDDVMYAINSTTVTVTVSKIDTSISVDEKSLELKVGDNSSVTAKLTPADAGNVTFTSSNPSVVTVDKNGNVKAVGAGSATVTASFAGSDKYNVAENVTVPVTVKKIDTSISVDEKSLELKFGDDSSVTAKLTPADAGKVTFTSSNSSVVTVDADGKVKAVGVGSATITVSFGGSDKYNAAENVTVPVTVSLGDAKVVAEDITLNVGANASIGAVTTPEGLNVTYVPDNSGIVTVKDGVVTAVKAGAAKVTLTVGGDGKYAKNSTIITVTVKKIDTSISVDEKSLDLKFDDDSSVTAKLTPAGAGNVTFTSSNSSIVTVDADGKVKAIGVGSATITASFGGSDKYNAAENVTVPVTVSLGDAKVVAEDITLNVGANAAIGAVTTPEGLNVTYVPDNSGIVTVKDGVVTAVKAGAAKVTLTVGGDGKYAKNSTIITVTVKKIDTSIEVDKKSLDLQVDDDSSVTAKLTPADAGKVTFTSSNSSVVTVDAMGKVKAIGVGSATITVSFAGSDKYNAAKNVTVSVKVSEAKQNASMDVDAGKAVEDENSTITVKLPKDATGNVTAVIEGNPYIAPVVNGTATIAVPGLRPGNYTAHIKYYGDDKYNPASKDINYEVEEIDKSDIISAPDVTKYFGGSERFVVNITDYKGNPVANKSVTLEINGKKYDRVTKDDGTTSVGLGLNSGVYNVTVTVGNKTLNSVVTILSTVNGSDVVKVYRNATQYYATFRDSEGNYLKEGTVVTFNINGVMYERKVTGSEGLAKLNLNLEQGTYILTAINPVTGEMGSNNITIISRLVENNDITKYYRNATQYTVKVLGDDGNPAGAGENVTFNINGIFYTRTTDALGIAKLNLNLQPDDYIITVEYKNCRVSNNIKILPVLSAKDISMKYRDGTKFVATLVDGQGKAFAGETIQFNINGVFYNRITDSNGQAKLNINLQPGQYIITSSYDGSNIANTVTISA